MKKIGFLSFGHWTPSPQSGTRSAAMRCCNRSTWPSQQKSWGRMGPISAYIISRVNLPRHSRCWPPSVPKPSVLRLVPALIDMRYENPLYMVEDAGAADLISGGRLQLGISRGSPEQVIDGWRYFGYTPADGETEADMARRHTEVLLDALRGEGFAEPSPQPMFPNPPGLLRVEPFSAGLRDRIWWGASSDATAVWAAKLGMNLQSSTLKNDETGEPFHVQQAKQIRAYREAWKVAGHKREPRVSVSRSIFALMDQRDRNYFGNSGQEGDQVGYIGDQTRAIFGRSYAAEPELLIKQLAQDEAIAEADTLLLTVPNQLGVEYNAHVIESILKHIAPALDWR